MVSGAVDVSVGRRRRGSSGGSSYCCSERGPGDYRPALVAVAAALTLVGMATLLGAKRLFAGDEGGRRLTLYRLFGRFAEHNRRHVRVHHPRVGFVSEEDPFPRETQVANERRTSSEQPSSHLPATREMAPAAPVGGAFELDPNEAEAQKQRQTREGGKDAAATNATLERQPPSDMWHHPHDKHSTETQLMPVGALGEAQAFAWGQQGKRRPLLFYILMALAGAKCLKHIFQLQGSVDPAAPSGPSPLADMGPEILSLVLPDFTNSSGRMLLDRPFFSLPIDIPSRESTPSTQAMISPTAPGPASVSMETPGPSRRASVS